MADQDSTRDPDFLHFAVDREIGHPREPLFEIAADVERYPEFLPGWKAVRKRRIDDDEYATDQMLAFGPVRERFTSRTHLERPHHIRVVSQSRTFRHFEVNWRFTELDDDRCRVNLDAHLGFKNRYMKLLVGKMIGGQLDDILHAFEARAGTCLDVRRVDQGSAAPLERKKPGPARRG